MRFSIVYNRQKYYSDDMRPGGVTKEQTQCGTVTKYEYRLFDLRFVQEITEYDGGAVKSLLRTENTGDANSGVITAICDFDEVLPFDADPAGRVSSDAAAAPDEGAAHVEACLGSACSVEDFRTVRRDFTAGPIAFSCSGGRSSDTWLPFFEVRRQTSGYLMGLGWSGQWRTEFTRTDEGVLVTAGLGGNIEFYLKPGEKIRTASVSADSLRRPGCRTQRLSRNRTPGIFARQASRTRAVFAYGVGRRQERRHAVAHCRQKGAWLRILLAGRRLVRRQG